MWNAFSRLCLLYGVAVVRFQCNKSNTVLVLITCAETYKYIIKPWPNLPKTNLIRKRLDVIFVNQQESVKLDYPCRLGSHSEFQRKNVQIGKVNEIILKKASFQIMTRKHDFFLMTIWPLPIWTSFLWNPLICCNRTGLVFTVALTKKNAPRLNIFLW